MRRLIGHQSIAEQLRRAALQGRLAGAYLITGSPTVGRTTLALWLAQTVLCRAAPAERPCGTCQTCVRIERASHPDVLRVEAGRSLGEGDATPARSRIIPIEQIRIVRQAAVLSPLEGQARFFIIRNAEDLRPEAADALLKTLEEPPPKSHLILTARDATLLSPTLASRCQRVALRLVPTPEISVALGERSDLGRDERERIARLAQGRVGWAIEAATAPAFLAAHDALRERLAALPEADNHGRLVVAADLASRYDQDRRSLEEPLRLLAAWWRDVLLVSQGCEGGVVNADLLARLRSVASAVDPFVVTRYLWRIVETSRLIYGDAHGYLVPGALTTESASPGLPWAALWPTGGVNARLALDTLLLATPSAARAA